MEIKFSDNEERELLSNPRAWAEKQERQKEFERDDARIDCQQKLEDINYHYYYKFIEAHNKRWCDKIRRSIAVAFTCVKYHA